MASGATTLATLLASLKSHAVAGAVVVGAAAATLAATGFLHGPSGTTPGLTGNSAPSTATQVAQCAGHNGQVARLAARYKRMFGGSAATATTDICTLFVGTGGRHYALGEVRQMLDIAAAIEHNNSNACLNNVSAPARSSDDSSDGDPGQARDTIGKSGDHGKPTAIPGASDEHDGNSPTAQTIPAASAATTMATIHTILSHVSPGTPLAKLAQRCGAMRPD